jgi:hypothetical protein
MASASSSASIYKSELRSMSITPTSFAVPASFASKPIIGVAAAADSVGRSPPRIAVAQPTGSGVAASFASKMTSLSPLTTYPAPSAGDA